MASYQACLGCFQAHIGHPSLVRPIALLMTQSCNNNVLLWLCSILLSIRWVAWSKHYTSCHLLDSRLFDYTRCDSFTQSLVYHTHTSHTFLLVVHPHYPYHYSFPAPISNSKVQLDLVRVDHHMCQLQVPRLFPSSTALIPSSPHMRQLHSITPRIMDISKVMKKASSHRRDSLPETHTWELRFASRDVARTSSAWLECATNGDYRIICARHKSYQVSCSYTSKLDYGRSIMFRSRANLESRFDGFDWTLMYRITYFLHMYLTLAYKYSRFDRIHTPFSRWP